MNLFLLAKIAIRLKFLLILLINILVLDFAFLNIASSDAITSSYSSYDECVPTLQELNTYVVRPQGDTCYNICDVGCNNTFSVTDSLNYNNELNDDIISLCKAYCKSGYKEFTSPKRTNTLSNNFFSSLGYASVTSLDSKKYYDFDSHVDPLVSTRDPFTKTTYYYYISSLFRQLSNVTFKNEDSSKNQICTPTIAAQDYYNTSLIIESGSQIAITLQNGTNEVMFCGHDIRKADPSYLPFNDNRSLDGGEDTKNYYFGPLYTNARNQFFYDPFLFVKNGDYLTISLYGDYSQGNDSWVNDDIMINKADYSGSTSATGTGCNYNSCRWVYASNGDWQGGSTDPNHYMFLKSNASSIGLSVSTYGNMTIKQANNATNTYPVYKYTGILSNYSTLFSRIGIRLYECSGNMYSGDNCIAHVWDKSWDGDDYGGLFIKLERKGCVHTDGTGLQYAIVPSGVTPGSSDWKAVPSFSNGSVTITANTGGYLYLRIKKITGSDRLGIACSTDNETCPPTTSSTYYTKSDYQDFLYNNVEGQYTLKIIVTAPSQ